ncbi:hypothetical protein [uncultured Treponema sp.]|uniref:hypothetical protein n=1 Tax=uncultured Treponema sp. TaxID=162155 RepID=UPI0015BEADA7|nr:hypothetical protein [uncultured Treponema sp.]
MKNLKSCFNLWLPFESEEESLKKIPEGNENGTDNEKALYFQKKFLQTADEKYFVKLWKLFTLLCLKAVRKEKRSKGFFLSGEDEAYKADIAVEYSLRRYLKFRQEKGEVYFITNFIAEAYNSVKHALYSESENDIFFEQCMELNGKPVDEVRKRQVFLNAGNEGRKENRPECEGRKEQLSFDFGGL